MEEVKTSFEGLTEIIGKTGALNLCEQYGGSTIYIRKTGDIPEGLAIHWIQFFGLDAYERMREKFGGQRVYIPAVIPEQIHERNAAIFARLCHGEKPEDIAGLFNLTVRSIHNIFVTHKSKGGQS